MLRLNTLGVATVLFMFACTGHASAMEYFVSRQGDDSNDGTSRTHAFATIQKGVDALEPGDTLTIGPGEYHEPVRRQGLGSAEAETLIRAAIPGTVLLRGDVPAPAFRKVEGEEILYVADFDAADAVQAVNELDTLTILEPMPNATEPAYLPGKFHYDAAAGKLYISSSDGRAPLEHRYSVSVTPTHGIYLSEPQRVILEGLAVTGFKAAREQPREDLTLSSTWGIFIANGTDCVIRDCHAYLNGQGIGVNSSVQMSKGYGGNVIERCAAWGNASRFGVGDRGGITLAYPSRDAVRESQAYLNLEYGINIRGGGAVNRGIEHKSRLIGNIAWGNGNSDIKIKTGHDNDHTTEHTVATFPDHDYDPIHSLFHRAAGEVPIDTIVLEQEEDLDPNQEFADPEHWDYRLQATSRFRGAMPDGGDRGPHPYEPTIYYLSPEGDDEADGLSLSEAWRTLSRAAEALQPGDTLYIEPGLHEVREPLALTGTAEQPIVIRGRGVEPAVLHGTLRLTQGGHVTFERLHFMDPMNVAGSEAVAFRNSRFYGGSTALDATGTTALEVRHCEFSGFDRSAIDLTDSTSAYLSGNLYDNAQSPALVLGDAEALRYSNYNSYREGAPAWQVSGESWDIQHVQQHHEPQSTLLSAAWTLETAATPASQAPRAARGPLGRPVGTYRDEPRKHELRLVQSPAVHSLSATTANLVWRTSLPAVCKIAWGPTPACENTASFNVDQFASFSLTDLEPGQRYYFRVESLTLPRDVAEDIDATVVAPTSDTLSFTTQTQDPQPKVYYVAPDGDNSNSGLDRDNAWRTVRHAAAQVNVGDTVRIAEGTYPERVRILATGSADAPITFESIPGEKVVMTGDEKKIGQIFVAAGKKHLRFDGFYFKDTSREPLSHVWPLQFCGEFHLYRCEDIQITRCFSDGRGGYSARFVNGLEVKDLLIRNCVILNKMSSSMMLWPAPDLRIEHCVIVRPMIQSFAVRNKADQKATITHSIFTDMMQKKADLNIALFLLDAGLGGIRFTDNCYYLRSFPPEERALLSGRQASSNRDEHIIEPIFADPAFAGDDTDADTFGADSMVSPGRDLNFHDFFTTHPELVKRDIGLQAERFADFQFGAGSDE